MNNNKLKRIPDATNKITAAIYCRVSTFMQGAADYSSLDAQEDQLKAYCKGKGCDVYDVCKDIKVGKIWKEKS